MKNYIGHVVAFASIFIANFVSANTQTGFNSSNRQFFDGDPYFNAPIAGLVNFTALQGGDSGIQLSPHAAFRVNRSQLSANMTGSVSTTSYNLFAHTLNQGIIFDWIPNKRLSLKLSAGIYQNALNATGTAMLKKNISLSSQVTRNVATKVGKQIITQAVTRTVTTTITPQQIGSLDVAADYTRAVAPYLGFGWGHSYIREKLTMSFDAGVIYVGDIDVSVSSKNTQYTNIPAVQNQIAQQSAQIEANYTGKYLPVATLAMTYRF